MGGWPERICGGQVLPPYVSKSIGAVESDTPAAESESGGPEGQAQRNKIRKATPAFNSRSSICSRPEAAAAAPTSCAVAGASALRRLDDEDIT